MIVIISSILMLMAMMSKLCLAEVQQKKKTPTDPQVKFVPIYMSI